MPVSRWTPPCSRPKARREHYREGMPASLMLVGAGKMGGAMLAGWLDAGLDPAATTVIDPFPPRR